MGIVGENIAKDLRSRLYKNFINKEIGFHDDTLHAPGILGEVLGKECLYVQNTGVETVGMGCEAAMVLIVGLGYSLYLNWKIALCGLLGIPFFTLGNVLE